MVNAGDNTGTTNGFRSTKRMVKLIREYFPTLPIVWINGNHDFWVRGKKYRIERIKIYKNL